MTDREDKYYIDLVLSGDTSAYSYLVDRYKDMVYSLALKMLKNEAEAEDLAQEVFINVFKTLSRFKGSAKFSTWLYRITYNRSISLLRKTKRELPTHDEVYLENKGEVDFPSIDSVDSEQAIAELRKAIKWLCEEDQLLIMLHYFQQQSVEEIAAVTALSVSNVKVKLYRIRKKLKSQIEKHLEPVIPVIH